MVVTERARRNTRVIVRALSACMGLLVASLHSITVAPLRAQSASQGASPRDSLPPIVREFRGAWVATVANIDWPSKRNLPVAEQQRELLAILDRAREAHLNAVILQVRPAADALYESEIEPWSVYLTGEQGRPPSPRWDPLAFAVREAHARGLELHAWFNPYRARHTGTTGALSARHIARTNPALVKSYGGYLWMDPGEPQVRARTLRVILDVVTRYDIDGVHLDDYFSPYPVTAPRARQELPFPDEASWQRYRAGGGALARDDWRRDNVNTLVRELAEGIRREKPWVKFGISPFGIWRPGTPSSVRGFDAYAKLYADARRWMHEGWGDYFTPQLYWPTYKDGQRYETLLEWWSAQNFFNRHLWPGNFTSRVGGTGAGAFSVSELLEQIRVTRVHPNASGNVHFSMQRFTRDADGMVDALLDGPYRVPALIPASPWMSAPPPPTPRAVVEPDGSGVVGVTLSTAEGRAPWLWVVRARLSDGWETAIIPGTVSRWIAPLREVPDSVVVSTVNRVGEVRSP